ncbi:uncharacterized protein LOC125238199 [Leguminivora glycinivorella]|uniref:uncharacterized protein LOC125238199 n=1 Tax=Leguminivora glycinivorella TaxID=1035111 RepID=UPI00200F6958|nr:uncharacterized protein LOC125238199 [Leguminivora glycinivorella]
MGKDKKYQCLQKRKKWNRCVLQNAREALRLKKLQVSNNSNAPISNGPNVQQTDPFNEINDQTLDDNDQTTFQNDNGKSPQQNVQFDEEIEERNEAEEISLTIEKEIEDSEVPNYVVQGRRVIDFEYFMTQLTAIESHGDKFGCRLSNLKIVQEKQTGLKSVFSYKCRMCGLKFVLNTCDDDAMKLDVNAGAVSGAIVTGIGWSNLNEINASMDLPTMSFNLYSSTHDDVAEIWRITAEQTMQKAAEDEREAAIIRGDVNDAGIAMIPVEADACWSKRSYRTNYSALSGVAAIVGEHTGKVLHVGMIGLQDSVQLFARRANSEETKTTPSKLKLKTYKWTS